MLVVIVLVLWIPCGVLTYGLLRGAWEQRFSDVMGITEADCKFFILHACLGPVGLVATMMHMVASGDKFVLSFNWGTEQPRNPVFRK
jgi:hypothetical protein